MKGWLSALAVAAGIYCSLLALAAAVVWVVEVGGGMLLFVGFAALFLLAATVWLVHEVQSHD
jgi:hypothetical protein